MRTRSIVLGSILLAALAFVASKVRWEGELRERARAVQGSRPVPITEIGRPSAAATTTPRPVRPSDEAVVARVFDGDSVQLTNGRGLRYIGIDAPEVTHKNRPPECFAGEATVVNRALVEGKPVRLERDVSNTDRYGRLLRYVYVGDTFVNDVLVRRGYARARAYPPDTRYRSELSAAEAEARAARRGLWGSACAGK